MQQEVAGHLLACCSPRRLLAQPLHQHADTGGRMEPKTKLLDQVRDAIRLRHLSLHTEEAYLGWISRFILFHHKRHPNDMGAEEVQGFLSHLAVHTQVAASTQNVALNVLL